VSQNGFRFLIVAFTLTALGVIMIYSSSAIFAYEHFGDSFYYLKRQLFYVAIGLLMMIAASLLDPYWIRKNGLFFVLIGMGSLVLVYLPILGQEGGGARRWINLGPFHLQPAEFIKIILTIYLADYLSRKNKEIQRGDWKVFLPPLVIFGIFSGLVIAQPDLGSVIIYFILTATLFFISGIRLRYFFGIASIVLPAVVLLVVMFPYRMARITAFLDPWRDPKGGGFQIIQSFIAFGVGGWSGVGLGGSTQKLFYLPQSFTDFIFSIIGEELGLIGTLVVLALFVTFFIFGFNITRKSKDLFLNLYSRGLILMILIQAFINIMVATGMIPTKGLPLPFISYGGSSLIMNLTAVGLILGVDRKLHKGKVRKR
jgi:cell division protein FtsW